MGVCGHKQRRRFYTLEFCSPICFRSLSIVQSSSASVQCISRCSLATRAQDHRYCRGCTTRSTCEKVANHGDEGGTLLKDREGSKQRNPCWDYCPAIHSMTSLGTLYLSPDPQVLGIPHVVFFFLIWAATTTRSRNDYSAARRRIEHTCAPL